MKRGVGIKFQCQFLSHDKLCQWLFDNVGVTTTWTTDGSTIVTNGEWYYTFNTSVNVLRIAIWTDLNEETAREHIQQMAKRVALECECNLTTYAVDLYEYDEAKQAHVLKYDALVGGPLETTVVKPDALKAAPKKGQRWN